MFIPVPCLRVVESPFVKISQPIVNSVDQFKYRTYTFQYRILKIYFSYNLLLEGLCYSFNSLKHILHLLFIGSLPKPHMNH